MGRIVNRHRRKEYNLLRSHDLMKRSAEPDRIAAALLAMSFSGQKSEASQHLIQMACVAVVFVNQEIWVASNGVTIDADIINDTLKNSFDKYDQDKYDEYDVYVVKNGRGKMHAEMQLVQELHGSKMLKEGSKYYIGVSKPCCSRCANILNELGIAFLHQHEDDVKGWEAPDLKKDSLKDSY